MKKVANCIVEFVKEVVIELLMFMKELLFIMIVDNGKEFVMYEQIFEVLGIDFYFVKFYYLWQRGVNENVNGLVWQYIFKKVDFRDYFDEYIEGINIKINQWLRKRFDFENFIFIVQKLIN